MMLSNQARTNRNVELHTKKNEIAFLYQQLKSDDEIAEQLHLAVPLVRATRDGMGLPPLRSKSGRLFTPDIDTRLVELRENSGLSYAKIGRMLGDYPAMDIQVRYNILKRLEEKVAKTSAYVATIPCILCRKPFVSEDRRKVRFCLPCRSDVVPKIDCCSYDPDISGICYSTGFTLPAA
jgi:hypothetical protein